MKLEMKKSLKGKLDYNKKIEVLKTCLNLMQQFCLRIINSLKNIILFD